MKKTQTPQVYNIIKAILISILMVSLYFCREVVQKYSDTHLEILKNYKIDVKASTKANNKLKKNALGTPDSDEYIIAYNKYLASNKLFKESKENEKVFGFNNLKSFLYKFGPNLFWFTLTLVFLIRSFHYERRNIGVKIILCTALSLTLYEFYYIFSPTKDLSLASYYFMGLATSIFMTLGLYYFTWYRKSYNNQLKANFLELASFTYDNILPEKREEMFQKFVELRNEK